MLFQNQKVLLNCFSKKTLIEYIQTNCTDEEIARLEEINRKWEIGQRIFQTLTEQEAGIQSTVDVRSISDVFNEKLKRIEQEPQFKNTYEKATHGFRMVEIDKLVTYQNGVYLDFVEKLLKELPRNPSEADLIDICLPLKKEYAPVLRLKSADSSYVYSSDSQDLRVIGSYSRPIEKINLAEDTISGVPVRCLITLIGYGLPIVSVLDVNQMLVLFNGFHRLYALRYLGVTHVPVLVQQIPTLADLPGSCQAQWFYNLIAYPRPPLMKDYFTPDLTIDTKTIPRKKTIKVTISHETIDFPI